MPLSRRDLARLAALGLCTALPRGAWPAVAGTADDSPGIFRHGIASGDPRSDRVVLWTRVTTPTAREVRVRWCLAGDETLAHCIARGESLATAASDFTVKVDVAGLAPGRTWYYRFDAAGEATPVGRTRTLPGAGNARARLAVASCANYPLGHFNAYADIAARHDLDAVLHLGDYLYEYPPGESDGGASLGRVHVPAAELVTLADYRLRYAQYRRDPDLQAAHRQHPWIVVWDDHEFANNAWRDGAANHQPEREGPWTRRRDAAVQAWFEWMPVREPRLHADRLRTYRSFAFGSLLDVVMLDTRLAGRDRQAARGDDAALADPARSLLGGAQAGWLAAELRRSRARGAAWRLVGQQLMFGQLLDERRRPRNPDQWDGYPSTRERVLEQLRAERIGDVVIASGDVHSAWALDVAADPFARGFDPATGRGALAVEMIAPGVTSPPPFPAAEAPARERALLAQSPHVRYVDFARRGYLLLDVDAERAQGEWHLFDSVADRAQRARAGVAFATLRGRSHLHPSTPAPAITGRPPLAVA